MSGRRGRALDPRPESGRPAIALARPKEWSAGPPGRAETLRYVDLAGFDDARGDVVRLVASRRPWGSSGVECVPTPDDTGRAALVEALAAAGVRRLGAGESLAHDEPPAGPSAPRLQIRPDVGARRLELLGCAAFTAGPLALVVLGLARVGAGVAVAVALGSWVVAMLAAVKASAHGRSIACFDDGLLLGEWDPTSRAPRPPPQLCWDDLVGWIDEGPRHVRLVLRFGLVSATYGDPGVRTPTPEVRAALEALLAEKGVPRIA